MERRAYMWTVVSVREHHKNQYKRTDLIQSIHLIASSQVMSHRNFIADHFPLGYELVMTVP